MWGKSIYNQTYLLNSNDYVKPGFILYNIRQLLSGDINLYGQYLPIYLLPINSIISSLFNYTNSYMTFALSSGSIAKKRKDLKKKKLIYVELPSGARILLPTRTYCLFASSQNLYCNRVVLGG